MTSVVDFGIAMVLKRQQKNKISKRQKKTNFSEGNIPLFINIAKKNIYKKNVTNDIRCCFVKAYTPLI